MLSSGLGQMQLPNMFGDLLKSDSGVFDISLGPNRGLRPVRALHRTLVRKCGLEALTRRSGGVPEIGKTGLRFSVLRFSVLQVSNVESCRTNSLVECLKRVLVPVIKLKSGFVCGLYERSDNWK